MTTTHFWNGSAWLGDSKVVLPVLCPQRHSTLRDYQRRPKSFEQFFTVQLLRVTTIASDGLALAYDIPDNLWQIYDNHLV